MLSLLDLSQAGISQVLLFNLCAALMFAIALCGFLLHQDFLRKLLALNVMGMAIFMLLISIANQDPLNIDPIPHALVLTGIVVAAAGTALGLNLASKITKFSRSIQNENQQQDLVDSLEPIKAPELTGNVTKPTHSNEQGQQCTFW